jgi:hypothetical protein
MYKPHDKLPLNSYQNSSQIQIWYLQICPLVGWMDLKAILMIA